MPFTLAHPAAVWPLKYVRFLAVIPLVIGSLMPDVASYLPDAHELINSHSVRGTIVLDLPLGYAALLILVALRSLLVEPLWEPHRTFISRAFSEYIANKYWWLLALPSLLLGSWTHILWDSFTHENHFMVRKLPVLQHVVTLDTDHTLHMYRLLQYGCSVLGIILVAWWYLYALSGVVNQKDTTNSRNKKILLVVMVVIALLAGLLNALFIVEWRQVYWFISTILTTAMPFFAVLYVAASIVFKWQNRGSHRAT